MSLAQDLLIWLVQPDVTAQKIYQYSRGLPEDVVNNISVFAKLGDALIEKIHPVWNELFSEQQEVDMAKKLAKILAKVEESEPQSLPPHSAEFLLLWQRLFAFITVTELEGIRTYVVSFVNHYSLDELSGILQSFSEVINDIWVSVQAAGYRDYQLLETQRTQLSEVIKGFDFLPEQIREEYLSITVTKDRFDKLVVLQTAIAVARLVKTTDAATASEITFEAWKVLQDRSRNAFMLQFAQMYGEASLDALAPERQQLIEAFSEYLAPDGIADDLLNKQFIPYWKELTPGQRKFVRQLFTEVFSTHEFVREILAPTDPGFILQKFESHLYPNGREEFILSLEDSIRPVYWRLAQKLLQSVAELY